MSNQKIITYHFADSEQGMGLTDYSTENILEVLKSELPAAAEDLDEDDEIIFYLKIRKKHTQEEIDSLPEWDGF